MGNGTAKRDAITSITGTIGEVLPLGDGGAKTSVRLERGGGTVSCEFKGVGCVAVQELLAERVMFYGKLSYEGASPSRMDVISFRVLSPLDPDALCKLVGLGLTGDLSASEYMEALDAEDSEKEENQ